MKERNENRPGYKKTKVGWIPEDWILSTLGHAEHFLTSGSRGWSQYYSDNGALFVRITNLTRESINLDYTDCRFVDIPTNGSEGTRTRLHAGDILISITADLGIIAHFSAQEPYPHAYVNQHVALLRLLDQNICSEFVAYQLAGPRSQRRFRKITDQGAKAGLNLPAIRSFPTILPSLPEQEAIAEVLECWDKAIRGYEKKIEKKRNIKKGLMQALLSGKRRLPGFGAELRIGNGECRIPEGWKEVRLGEIASFAGGHGFPENLQGCEIGNIPFIKVSDMNLTGNETYIRHANNFVSHDVIEERRWKPLPADSVVFAKVGAALLLNRRRILVTDTLIDNNMMGAVVRTGISPAYLYIVLLKLDFSNLVQVGALPSVNQSQLSTQKTLLPGENEQQAIVSVLSAADAEIETLERKLTALREQKRFLLNNLVTGTIRLPEFRKN